MDYLNAEHTGSDGAEGEDFLSLSGNNRHDSADLSRDRHHKLSSYFNLPPKLPEIPLTPEFPIYLVTTPRQLQDLVQKLEGTSLFSLDMKTYGTRSQTEDVSLVQVSLPLSSENWERGVQQRKGETYLIDLVTLQRFEDLMKDGPLESLRHILEDPQKVKVLHHGGFERKQLQKYGIQLEGALDTERLMRTMRPDVKSYSLRSCVREMLGENFTREELHTSWKSRPLTETQIESAALDTEVTLRLYEKMASIEKRATPSQRMLLGTLLKRLGETKSEQQTILDDYPEARDSLMEYQQVADAIREQLHRLLSAEAEQGLDRNYRGPMGVAAQSVSQVEVVNIEKLRHLLPERADELIEEKVVKKDLEATLTQLGRKKEVNAIWEDIHRETGEYSTPAFRIVPFVAEDGSLSDVDRGGESRFSTGKGEPSSLLETKLGYIREEESKEILLELLREAEFAQLDIKRESGLGEKLAYLEARVQKHSERICERLIELADGARSGGYRSQHGTARFSSYPLKELRLDYFRKQYPELAEQCITEHVTKAGVRAALTEEGKDSAATEAILQKIFQPTGERRPSRIIIRPKYTD